MGYIDETKKEEMKELIEEAKKQVKNWYNPDTPRKFIKTQIWSASREFPGKSGSLTELYILEGGEAKGTIIADYFNGVVTAYDKFHINVLTRRTMFNDRRHGEDE